MAANADIVSATAVVNISNSDLQIAQMRLNQIVSEVQYRMGLIAQLKGGQHQPGQDILVSTYVPPFVYETSGSVSSIPAAPPQRQVQIGPRIRSESAESVRAEEVGVRAAI
jgi:hypothetical protein